MGRLERMRAALKQQDDRRSGNNNNRQNQDKTIYPFWDIEENSNTVIRFLPDKDDNNPFIWVERLMINLPFSGVKGDPSSKPVTVRVPCMEMYGEPDYIIAETKPWWGTEFEDTARIYWKKRSYLFQGFVVRDGLNEKPEDKPENPIRRFIIGPQIHQIIKAFVNDPDVKDDPVDEIVGLDFKITKTMKGKYADYATSSFSRSSRPLSEEELDAINTYGLNNLSDFLPKKPTEEEQEMIKEMFAASVDGEAFDPERWGQHFKAYGSNESPDTDLANNPTVVNKPVAKVEPKVVPTPVVNDDDSNDDDTPFDTTATATVATTSDEEGGANSRAKAMLAAIRNRP